MTEERRLDLERSRRVRAIAALSIKLAEGEALRDAIPDSVRDIKQQMTQNVFRLAQLIDRWDKQTDAEWDAAHPHCDSTKVGH